MGIPSFYKHLIQTIGGLTSKTRTSPKVFALDLNCAIYYCVRKVQQRFPYNPEVNTKWEKELIDTVLAYITMMEKRVNPTTTLYIGVDGVAPMAKIKQQRLRRFKSARQAEDELKIREMDTTRWDTNAITPGTVFMEKLTVALRDYAKTHKKVVVSPADEPGEGEQKIMAWIRDHKPTDVVVYGLDADLIVLSLWMTATTGVTMDLFREDMEFNGTVKEDSFGDTEFLYLDIGKLGDILHTKYGKKGTKPTFLRDFVGLVNLLGNDFVPHGLTLKIRDEGIETLLEMYGSLEDSIIKEDETYNVKGLQTIFRHLARDEPAHLLKTVVKKLTDSQGKDHRPPHGKTAVERELSEYNDQPLKWAVERCIVDSVYVEGFEKPRLQLKPKWKTIYDEKALISSDAPKVYLESLAWCSAYYAGKSVDMDWYYPWYLPPRLEEIVKLLETLDTLPCPTTVRPPLKPTAQLAMVLPQSSYHLLPLVYQSVPKLVPYAFPTEYQLFSFGRRFLWECEPLIPLLSREQIRVL